MNALSLLTLLACKSSAPDSANTGRIGPTAEQCHGFAATPAAWAVPNPDYVFSAMWSEGLGQLFSLLDIDGDRDLDLITTRDGVSSTFEGPDGYYWELRRNNGAAFGEMEPWSVPAVDELDLVRAWEANTAYEVLDLNGDGILDLVRATDPTTDALPAGEPHWLFYPGGPTGFAPNAQVWPIPTPVGADFTTLRSNTSYHSWRLADMDGDGLQDLVHASDPDGSGGPFGAGSGSPHWRVYRNDGAGFATEATEWALPTADNPRHFGAWEGRVGDRWTLVDLDRDGRADLVETTDPDDPSFAPFADDEGFPYWRLHSNTGAGFEDEGSAFWTPDATFDVLNSPEGWDSTQSLHWRTLEMGGGESLDLVIATDPDSPSLSQSFYDEEHGPQWGAFSFAGTGFAFQHEPWEVPDRSFHRFHYGDPASRGSWETLDLNGDGCMDLLVAAVEDMAWPGFSHTGAWSWRVYVGE